MNLVRPALHSPKSEMNLSQTKNCSPSQSLLYLTPHRLTPFHSPKTRNARNPDRSGSRRPRSTRHRPVHQLRTLPLLTRITPKIVRKPEKRPGRRSPGPREGALLHLTSPSAGFAFATPPALPSSPTTKSPSPTSSSAWPPASAAAQKPTPSPKPARTATSTPSPPKSPTPPYPSLPNPSPGPNPSPPISKPDTTNH